jgi:hypothetical protein
MSASSKLNGALLKFYIGIRQNLLALVVWSVALQLAESSENAPDFYLISTLNPVKFDPPS